MEKEKEREKGKEKKSRKKTKKTRAEKPKPKESDQQAQRREKHKSASLVRCPSSDGAFSFMFKNPPSAQAYSSLRSTKSRDELAKETRRKGSILFADGSFLSRFKKDSSSPPPSPLCTTRVTSFPSGTATAPVPATATAVASISGTIPAVSSISGTVPAASHISGRRSLIVESTSSPKQMEELPPSDNKFRISILLTRFFKNRPTKQQLIEKKIIPADFHLPDNPVIPLRLIPLTALLKRIMDIDGLLKEGIFRIPGAALTVREIWRRLEEPAPDYSCDGPATKARGTHEYVSALKLYLREAPEPIVPFAYYQKFINVIQLKDSKKQLDELQQVFANLPNDNYQLLVVLCVFLKKTTLLSPINKMDAKNIGLMIGPSFMRKTPDETAGLMDLNATNLQSQLVTLIVNNIEKLFPKMQQELKEFTEKYRTKLDSVNSEISQQVTTENQITNVSVTTSTSNLKTIVTST